MGRHPLNFCNIFYRPDFHRLYHIVVSKQPGILDQMLTVTVLLTVNGAKLLFVMNELLDEDV